MKKGGQNIPDYEYENLARHFLPQIQAFFETEQGRKEFEKWKGEQAEIKSQISNKTA